MSSTPAEIGARIKAARKAQKMSQTELAQKLDKTLRTVQKYESGEIEPSIMIINSIAKILSISPIDLIGYERRQIKLNSMADVMSAFEEIRRKKQLNFTIDVKRPPQYDEWSCSIKFNGNDKNARDNASLCLFLERYRDYITRLETYWVGQETFDKWLDEELLGSTDEILEDREIEDLSFEERIRRCQELNEKIYQEKLKSSEEKK